MAIYSSLKSLCSENNQKPLLSPLKKEFIPEVLVAIASIVLGILSYLTILPAPAASAYALLALGGVIVIINTIYLIYHNCKNSESKNNTVSENEIHIPIEGHTPQTHPKSPDTSDTAPNTKLIAPVITCKPFILTDCFCKDSAQKPLCTSFYQFNDKELTLFGFNTNTITPNGLPASQKNGKVHRYPTCASPTYGKDSIYFESPANGPQYIGFSDCYHSIWLNFKRDFGATFMKPNVDTMLVCSAISIFVKSGGDCTNAIDVGSGSGFIAKYLAYKKPSAKVTAIDIDPVAGDYMNSVDAALPMNVTVLVEDALPHLEKHIYDFVVSNPPYVPTEQETKSNAQVAITDPSFWEGTAVMNHLLENTIKKMPVGGHIVMLVSSVSLQSKRLKEIFQRGIPGVTAKILVQQEVAFKHWFITGAGKDISYLMASHPDQTTHFKGLNLDLFEGLTDSDKPRDCRVEDGRRGHKEFYWQMIYIIDFEKTSAS